MSTSGFGLSKIVVLGPDKADAVLAFRPGLNVIAGASNTGKTYAWQLIDFLLGASTQPKDIPSARGYSRAMAELRPQSGGVLTMVRSLAGGNAMAFSAPIGGVADDAAGEVLGERHAAGNPNTISGRLLMLTGLLDKQIRKNSLGAKRSLSFRDVAQLTLVDEERIITERSPSLSGQVVSVTEEKSTLGLFLTGVDDAAIVAQEAPKGRKQRIELTMNVLRDLLEERGRHLKSYNVAPEQLPALMRDVAEAIKEACTVLATHQDELNRAAAVRDKAWSDLQTVESRRLFFGEQVKRLELLQRHYASDLARLESSLEAGELFECLPQGVCQVCGRTPEHEGHGEETELRLRQFQEACQGELGKIAALSRDLAVGLEQMRAEGQKLDSQRGELQGVLHRSNAAIRELMEQKVTSTKTKLSDLLQRQGLLSEIALVAEGVADLRKRYEESERELAVKMTRPKLAKKVEAAGVAEFCEVVAKTLRAWKFPLAGHVSWSDDRFDLIIGDENRGSLGKGYRAITYAAFTVSLMRYCRMKGLPHTGLIVLDTPLNPYRGPDRSGTEGMNMDVQEAFYADLAVDASGDQVIVFENTEPPQSLRSVMQYQHFSGTAGESRAGFFP